MLDKDGSEQSWQPLYLGTDKIARYYKLHNDVLPTAVIGSHQTSLFLAVRYDNHSLDEDSALSRIRAVLDCPDVSSSFNQMARPVYPAFLQKWRDMDLLLVDPAMERQLHRAEYKRGHGFEIRKANDLSDNLRNNIYRAFDIQ